MSRVVNLFPGLRNDHRMDTNAYVEFLDEAENGYRDSGKLSTLPKLSDPRWWCGWNRETIGILDKQFLSGGTLDFWATN
jgi:hypothetical protein